MKEFKKIEMTTSEVYYLQTLVENQILELEETIETFQKSKMPNAMKLAEREFKIMLNIQKKLMAIRF